ncbi:ROK family protein [Schumannella soli]|uniref:ROK family protein n=1 Tax=Schumannella soli TaxID=2590779 RepID=A0A506Y5V2_9MICO|nr:ROK family protein [Schumannella soli]TPW76398.1 ROK family protein [Schumannella soli]
MHAIGIDIGGTKIAGAVVTELGEIVEEQRRPSPAEDPDAMVDVVVEMIADLASRHEVSGAGVAAAGFIDAAQSTVYYAPNIAWRNEPLRQRIEERLPGLDITVDNDANAAGWAEFRFGAGRIYSDMTMLTIGTGVGGAVVVGDRLLRGGFGTGGEIGHLRVVPGGLPCGCGARGCIEQYGSGRALLRMANEIADAGGIGRPLADARAQAEASGGKLDGGLVGGLIAAHDPGALAALRELGGWLGQACASLGAVLDPQIFVFGGGVAVAGDLLLDPVREAYLAHLPARGYHPEPQFLVAELVNDAGVVGAADLARLHADAR